MKRIILIILRNFYRIPYGWMKLCCYAKNPDRYSENERYLLIRQIADWIIKGGRIDLEIYGVENIPKENGFMMFSNHQGLFDGFAIVQALETPFSTIYKRELDKVPFVKQICSCVKAIALDRENARQGMEVIKKVTNEVKNGHNFMVFPEGTRSKNGNHLLDFKGGSFRSAVKARCTIIPIALIDSYKVFDTNSMERTTVQVHFLPPISFNDCQNMKTVEIATKVKKAIEEVIANNTRE